MGKYFADIHADAKSQLSHGEHGVLDTEEIMELRKDTSYEGLMKLGKALCYQLRYREAVDVYTRAIEKNPKDIVAYRNRGGRYLSTLRPQQAIEDFMVCSEGNGDKMDLSYRIGLARFFLKDYAGAMKEMEVCYPLCDDEMGVAAIFWHTLAAWRQGEEPSLLKKYYHTEMKVGHHTAYNYIMGAVSKEISVEDIVKKVEQEESDLEYSIMAYGLANFLTHLNRREDAQTFMEKIIKRDSFWISYAYIAAWNDCYGLFVQNESELQS